jgi:hypothetical protein
VKKITSTLELVKTILWLLMKTKWKYMGYVYDWREVNHDLKEYVIIGEVNLIAQFIELKHSLNWRPLYCEGFAKRGGCPDFGGTPTSPKPELIIGYMEDRHACIDS